MSQKCELTTPRCPTRGLRRLSSGGRPRRYAYFQDGDGQGTWRSAPNPQLAHGHHLCRLFKSIYIFLSFNICDILYVFIFDNFFFLIKHDNLKTNLHLKIYIYSNRPMTINEKMSLHART